MTISGLATNFEALLEEMSADFADMECFYICDLGCRVENAIEQRELMLTISGFVDCISPELAIC